MICHMLLLACSGSRGAALRRTGHALAARIAGPWVLLISGLAGWSVLQHCHSLDALSLSLAYYVATNVSGDSCSDSMYAQK